MSALVGFWALDSNGIRPTIIHEIVPTDIGSSAGARHVIGCRVSNYSTSVHSACAAGHVTARQSAGEGRNQMIVEQNLNCATLPTCHPSTFIAAIFTFEVRLTLRNCISVFAHGVKYLFSLAMLTFEQCWCCLKSEHLRIKVGCQKPTRPRCQGCKQISEREAWVFLCQYWGRIRCIVFPEYFVAVAEWMAVSYTHLTLPTKRIV